MRLVGKITIHSKLYRLEQNTTNETNSSSGTMYVTMGENNPD